MNTLASRCCAATGRTWGHGAGDEDLLIVLARSKEIVLQNYGEAIGRIFQNTDWDRAAEPRGPRPDGGARGHRHRSRRTERAAGGQRTIVLDEIVRIAQGTLEAVRTMVDKAFPLGWAVEADRREVEKLPAEQTATTVAIERKEAAVRARLGFDPDEVRR